MERVFLDANVLFSAAYSEGSKLSVLLWSRGVTLVTSTYAIDEATRNLSPEQNDRLSVLLEDVEVVPLLPAGALPKEAAVLPETDRPILLAAIGSGATHLLTGDLSHFGTLYGRTVGGVLVLPPARYLTDTL